MGPDRMASALSGPAKPNNKRSSNASSGLIAFRTSTPPNDPWQNISAYLFDAASQNPLANANFPPLLLRNLKTLQRKVNKRPQRR